MNSHQQKWVNYQKSSYRKYLNSDEWKEIREIVKERDGHKCLICNCSADKDKGIHLSVHHRTYENKYNERENLGDLITLCKSCHDIFHNIKKYKKIHKEDTSAMKEAKKEFGQEIKELKNRIEDLITEKYKKVNEADAHRSDLKELSEKLIEEALYHLKQDLKKGDKKVKSLSKEALGLYNKFNDLKLRLRTLYDSQKKWY